ncbi:MAG TPA: Spy/CpxP family protein refolding chaperone [Bryobacteraceae bacterium]|nr:Spy/CpxP family protein refolding chaperone [Bryobacteraceae bacterium]
MKKQVFRLFGAAALATGLMMAQNTGTTATPPAGHGQWMVKRATQALNLSTDQQTQLQQIITNFRQQAQPLHQKLRTDEAALMTAAKTQANGAQLDGSAVGADLANLAVLRAQAFGQFYKILNPDQQAKVDAAGGHMPMFGGRGFGHGR